MYSLGYLIMLLSYVIFCIVVVIVNKIRAKLLLRLENNKNEEYSYLTLLEIFILNSNKTIAQQYITVGTLLSIRK
jgi:hypothetical protein